MGIRQQPMSFFYSVVRMNFQQTSSMGFQMWLGPLLKYITGSSEINMQEIKIKSLHCILFNIIYTLTAIWLQCIVEFEDGLGHTVHYKICIEVFKYHSVTLKTINKLQLVKHVTNFCSFSENDARLVTPTLGPSMGYFCIR